MAGKLGTGVDGLDRLLGGGIPSGASVLVYGHPLSGKRPLLMSFIHRGLEGREPALLVLTDHSYQDWKMMMGWSGWRLEPFEERGLVACVDASPAAFAAKELPPQVVRPDNPEALNALSIAITRASEALAGKGAPRIVFSSLSTLLQKNDAPTLYRFLQFVKNKLKAMGTTVLYSLDLGMIAEKDALMIEHLMDGVIEVGEGRLRVRGFLDSATNEWVAFSMRAGKLFVGEALKEDIWERMRRLEEKIGAVKEASMAEGLRKELKALQDEIGRIAMEERKGKGAVTKLEKKISVLEKKAGKKAGR
ncbi:MAG: RAD55 family ATPase [Candidatus Micrarchaeia archaeon]